MEAVCCWVYFALPKLYKVANIANEGLDEENLEYFTLKIGVHTCVDDLLEMRNKDMN